MAIKFSDVCLVTRDVLRLKAFYETVFGVKVQGDEYHSGCAINGYGFSFDNEAMLREIPAFGYASGQSSDNVIIGFDIDDVDAEYRRLVSLGIKTLNEPVTHPWGARSFQFRDPDGNILNFRGTPK